MFISYCRDLVYHDRGEEDYCVRFHIGNPDCRNCRFYSEDYEEKVEEDDFEEDEGEGV